MKSSIKAFLLFFYKLHNRFFSKLNQWRNFELPNSAAIMKEKIILIKKCPSCQQLTKITGLGKVEIGTNCSFGYKLGGFHKAGLIEIQPRYKDSIIKIGNNVATNNNIFFCAAHYIEIGDDSLIGLNVIITDHEAHGIDPLKRRQIGEIGKVIVGKNVWIGNNVTILKNSEMGDNVIIAAGAIVCGKFPANVIIGGIPAKIIRNL
ncbi:MAG TPA: acyltransferase [Prolixibacteraceae bacterium]|jgi:acetyltransferase-like isoleucine patch superfamily enzyme